MDIREEFLNFFKENNISLEGKTFILAVSCGVDSMVMLSLFEKYKDIYKYNIVVCHVNHKKRAESEDEEEFIKKYTENKYKLHILHLKEKENDESFQEYARNERFKFFFECMEKEKGDYLCLAHHLNDDIETSLMHILRGASLDSIKGINSNYIKNGYTIIRPLLKVLKKDIYEYALKESVIYFEDKTNLEDNYARNRIRHNIVSNMFKENPSFGDNFLSFKEKITYASNMIDSLRDNFIKEYVSINDKCFSFKEKDFMLVDDFLKKEVLFYLLKKYSFSDAFILELVKVIKGEKKNLVLNINGICFIKEKGIITISYERYEKENIELIINDFGTYHLNDEYDISFIKKERIKNCDLSISNINNIWYNTDMFPFTIRNRKEGDKILLSSGHKKIKDLMIDMHMSKTEKDKALILLDKNEDIIALLGYKKSNILSLNKDNDLIIELIRRK